MASAHVAGHVRSRARLLGPGHPGGRTHGADPLAGPGAGARPPAGSLVGHSSPRRHRCALHRRPLGPQAPPPGRVPRTLIGVSRPGTLAVPAGAPFLDQGATPASGRAVAAQPARGRRVGGRRPGPGIGGDADRPRPDHPGTFRAGARLRRPPRRRVRASTRGPGQAALGRAPPRRRQGDRASRGAQQAGTPRSQRAGGGPGPSAQGGGADAIAATMARGMGLGRRTAPRVVGRQRLSAWAARR